MFFKNKKVLFYTDSCYSHIVINKVLIEVCNKQQPDWACFFRIKGENIMIAIMHS